MSTMSKMKCRKSTMSSGLHSDISSFFSKVPPKSSNPGTTIRVKEKVPDIMQTCDRQDTRFPLSPLTIPETPESEKKHHCPKQPFSVGPCSPVSRSPHSRGLSCKTKLLSSRLLQPQNETSPKSGDTFEAENCIGQFGSVKRLIHGLESQPKAKRPRTGQVLKSVEQESLSEGDEISKFLLNIHESANLKDKTLMKGFSKNIEKKLDKAVKTLSVKNCLITTVPGKILGNMTSEKKNGAPGSVTNLPPISHRKISSSEDEKENTPLSTEPSTDYTEISSDNQSDLVVSYTSWVCNNDGEKEKSKQVNNLDDKEKAITTAEENLNILDDSWFNDQMEQSFQEPEHKKSKTEKKDSIPEHVILSSGLHNRYWVLDVQEATGAQGYIEKHLTITCSKSSHPTETCVLKDGWENTPVAVGDIVHLEGECVSGYWVIDRNSGYLVLLPDVLISGTSVANSVRCMRRAVLGEMFKSLDGGSKQMLNGTIVHDIFQKAAMSLDFSAGNLEKFASEALLNPNYLGQMYSLKLTQADMKQEVDEYLPAIAEWAKDYLHTSAQARQKQLTFRLPSDGALSRQDSACSITVTDFVDIEENIWSPRFGLKGKVDVTAGVRIHRRGRRHVDKIVPLELKTGKESNSIEHRSQVILYTLMSTERRTDAEAGFLVYLKTGNLHPIVGNHMDRRELIKLRNSLVQHLSNSLIKKEGKSRMACLPEVISDQQACKYCPQRRNCALYSRAVEKASVACPSEDPQAFLQHESEHLNQLHLQYFSHWLLLCSLEALTIESKRGRRNIWLQSAQERFA